MGSCEEVHQHSERGKKTRQTEEEVGRQHQGMDRPGVRQVPEGSEEQGKMENTGCKIICCAPMTIAVKGLMMMMMMMMMMKCFNRHDKIETKTQFLEPNILRRIVSEVECHSATSETSVEYSHKSVAHIQTGENPQSC